MKESIITSSKSKLIIVGCTVFSSGPDLSSPDSYNQLTYRTAKGRYNTYNREKLYEEVWAKPVVDVAVQYGVSDVAIHKICNSLDVPVPLRGYWSKIRAGGIPKKTPLLKTKGITEIAGIRTFEGVKLRNSASQPLVFFIRRRATKSTACRAANPNADRKYATKQKN